MCEFIFDEDGIVLYLLDASIAFMLLNLLNVELCDD